MPKNPRKHVKVPTLPNPVGRKGVAKSVRGAADPGYLEPLAQLFYVAQCIANAHCRPGSRTKQIYSDLLSIEHVEDLTPFQANGYLPKFGTFTFDPNKAVLEIYIGFSYAQGFRNTKARVGQEKAKRTRSLQRLTRRFEADDALNVPAGENSE